MITNTGKDILSKYLVGTVSSYASYIAFGCGAKPLSGTDSLNKDAYATKTSLDYEMFRAPIVSRGYVTNDLLDSEGNPVLDGNGNPSKYNEIVFTAELPTSERYEISELGVYSSGTNPAATDNQSKNIFLFARSENWVYQTDGSSNSIPVHSEELSKVNGSVPPGAQASSINVEEPVFQANADDPLLISPIRTGRNERPRFLNSAVFMRGDLSQIDGTSEETIAINPANTDYLELNAVSLNLQKYSSQDEVRLAFSVINKDETTSSPNSVNIILEFVNPGSGSDYEYARLKASLSAVNDNFTNNRYFVVSKKLEELEKSSGFSWQEATTARVYATVYDGGSPSSDYYVVLDAARVENLSSVSPIYGLTGYTVTQTTSGLPLLKEPNTVNLVEFRFAMDVG